MLLDSGARVSYSVAMWFIFIPKIPILVGLGMEKFGIFYSQLVYFTGIWYLLWTFGIPFGQLVYFFSFWYRYRTKENITTLMSCTGLPDFSWCNKPKRGKIYQKTKNIPNGHKIDQLAVK
jgi:hypothetical protein